MIRFLRSVTGALALSQICAGSAFEAKPELRRRDGPTTIYLGPDPTCGYYGGKKESSLTCNPSFTCVVIVMENRSNLGCCPGGDLEACPTILPTTWLGLDEAESSGYCTSGTCAVPTMTGVCDKRANGQHAVANTVLDPAAEAWICQPTDVAPLTIATTYDGQKNTPVWQKAIIGATDGSDTSASSPSATSSETGEAEGDDGGSSPPIGPIIGGVLGGIAVLTLIGAGLFIMIKRSNRQKQKRQDVRYHSVGLQRSSMQGLPSPLGSAKMASGNRTQGWPQSPSYGQGYEYGQIPGSAGEHPPISSMHGGWQDGLHRGIHEADGADIHEMPAGQHA